MPLELPNLDDRNYTDLVEEARRLISIYDPDWTNHNPSDPGITLLELFAYLSEMLIYRLDRVTVDNQNKFLKLLNGPGWTPGDNLNSDIRDTISSLRDRERAVTAGDYELLALDNFNCWLAEMTLAEQNNALPDEWWQVTHLDSGNVANLPSHIHPVARASCVPARNLERGTEQERNEYAPSHVSLIILPMDTGVLQPSVAQKTALWGYLDLRRTLTTRHHVVGPYYAPVSAEIVVASSSGAIPVNVRTRILDLLEFFLSPITDELRQAGWPFGRDVFVSELIEQIESVDGVDYVTDIKLESVCLPTDQQCAAATPLWHAEGELIGLELAQHYLPLARFNLDPESIVVSDSVKFVSAHLAVTLTASTSSNEAVLKRMAKLIAREFFHPRYATLKQITSDKTGFLNADLKTMLESISGVTDVEIILQANSDRLYLVGDLINGLYVNSDEIVNWQVDVNLVYA